MPTKQEVEDRLEKILTSRFNGFERYDDFLSAQQNSTSIRLWASDDGDRVTFFAPIAFDVPLTDELCWYVITQSSTSLAPWSMNYAGESRERVNVGFYFQRPSEGLDEEEVVALTADFAVRADDIDDDFVARFGGTTNFS